LKIKSPSAEVALTSLDRGANQFGSAFYAGDESIGGDQDYCEQGACLFTLGVRAFFLLDFATQGDGITFTLTSFGPPLAPHNSATSVGGDIELSELMGYAGDSRLVPDPDPLNDLDFLATNPNDRGLDPPKIAVEFDTRTDNDTFDYCEDPLNANANQRTRNDPLSGEKDAVQYVFWGRTNFLNIPCRGLPPPPPPNDINNPLYDDNRHDADGEDAEEEWAFGTTGLVDSSPAIGSDGTIYVISGGILYAINPDGSPKWDFSTKTLLLSPAYDDNGTPADITDDTIYAVGSSDGFLYAIKSDGTQKGLSWPFNSGEDLDGGPTVGPDGTIYAGRDWNSAGDPGQVIAVNPDGTSKGLNWPFLVPSAVENDIDARPAVDDNGTPADTTDDTIYAASEDGFLYAINPDGTSKGLSWPFSVGYVTSRATIGADGTIYVGSRDSKVYAIKPDGTSKGLSWPFDTAGAIMTSPAYDDNGTPADITDDTIYIGSDDGHLYAINPNGTEKWRFPASGSIGAVQSSPAIDFDGTIYFGSNDGIVYAVNPDGTERWQFLTGGPVRSSPAIGKEGFIHIGSDDTNVYAINQFADPRNIKDKLLTFEDLGVNPIDLDDTNDWLNGKFGVKGPYAVRLEVDRSIIDGDGDGFFDYQLSLWIRQCQNLDCSDINGTFFSDTRIDYENAPASINLPMIQQFRLSAAEQVEFERFYFGFTGATGAGQTQDALISQFNLSFIRPGDPIVDVAAGDDLNWLP
jgi:outer membrane protein assembly factor BamB